MNITVTEPDCYDTETVTLTVETDVPLRKDDGELDLEAIARVKAAIQQKPTLPQWIIEWLQEYNDKIVPEKQKADRGEIPYDDVDEAETSMLLDLRDMIAVAEQSERTGGNNVRPSQTFWLVVQHGGSSRDGTYPHLFDSEADADAYIKECEEAAYDTNGPFRFDLPLVFGVKTWHADSDSGHAEPTVPVCVEHDGQTLRVIPGASEPSDMDCPDIFFERRKYGWCIVITPLNGGDPAMFVLIHDDGRVFVWDETDIGGNPVGERIRNADHLAVDHDPPKEDSDHAETSSE